MDGYVGKHVIVELMKCPADVLNSVERVGTTLLNTAKKLQVTVLHHYFHQFSPQGVSGVIVIAESHVSVHTWPELGYAAVDIFTCGSMDPVDGVPELQKGFKAEKMQVTLIKRGPECIQS